MIHPWRKEFQDHAASVFPDKRDPKQKAASHGYTPGESPEYLKKIIGDLTAQNELLFWVLDRGVNQENEKT